MPPNNDLMMLQPDDAELPITTDMFGFGDQQQPDDTIDRPQADIQRLISNINNPNIAADLDESELSAIGQKVLREYEIDLASRSDWEDKSRKAMDLAMQVAKAKMSPWPNSSNVIFPLMTTAAVQFAARAYPAIVQGKNVVKGVVVGKDDGTPMPPQMMQLLMMGMGGGMQGGGLPMLPQPPGGVPTMPATQGGAPGMPPQGPQMGAGGPQGGPPGGMPQMWLVPPGAKQERATRIGDHMSWQLLEEMTEWEEETDRLLHILPIVGCCFRKSYYDPGMGCNSSVLVLAQNLVVQYHAKSIEKAPRVTEQVQLYPYEVEEQIRAGLFIDQAYDKTSTAGEDEDAPIDFLEQHRWLDLDDDDYPEPYIVTVHKATGKVARITARYDAEGVHLDPRSGSIQQIDPVHYYTKYDFLPNPDGGIYGVGFGQLLSPINEAVNTTLNQMFDAASLQTMGGGWIGRGMSMHSGSLKFKLGEWKMANVPGAVLKDSIVPHTHPGPSPVLFQLLGTLIESGREIASVKDVLSGETAAATMQPTTLMALIEQGLKVFTAIFKRVHRALHKELEKLYRLNRIYLQQQANYRVGDEWRTVSQEDYVAGAGVTPYSDPTMVTDMQRMAQAQFIMGLMQDPNINHVEALKRVIAAAQIEKPEALIIEQTPPNPMILEATANLELKHREADTKDASAKAGQIRDISQALLNIANAEKATAAIDQAQASLNLEHSAQFIDLLELHLKSLLEPAEGRGGQAAPQMPTPQPPMPPLPPPSAVPGMGGY